MLGLVLVLALTGTPQHRLFKQPNMPRTSYAFFEFAPTNGAGMGAACACTTPTGAKGETLTFTRNSVAYCTKGNLLAGINNGDLVECSANQPRVMPGGDGSGGVGLMREPARTNSAPRSQELENASWADVATGVAAPTRTANAAVAPDGTTTADRLQFTATAAAEASGISYAATVAGAASASVYLKGNGSAGTVDLCLRNATSGSTCTCTACSYVAGSWTRCTVENVADADSNGSIFIGNLSTLNGGTARAANDVFAWGAQWEVGAYASSYVKTAAATASRVAEVASFSVTLAGATRSFAATWSSPSRMTASVPVLLLSKDASNAESVYATSSAASSTVTSNFRIGGSDNTRATTATFSAVVPSRLAAYYDGASRAACLNGTCLTTAGALTLMSGVTTVYIGGGASGSEAGGVVKRICIDPSPTRCTDTPAADTFYAATTNSVVWSQNVSSGWSATNVGSSNPTVTSNTSDAPACADVYNVAGCGLTKADRIQAPALSDGQLSDIYQAAGCPSGTVSGGVYFKGTSGSGTVDVYAGGACSTCAFTASSWTRCEANGGTASNNLLAIGNIATSGGTCTGAKAALDVQFWQADCQNAATVTPPIGPTDVVSLTRPPGHVYGATKKLVGMGDSITASTGSGLDPAPVGVAYALGPEYAWIQGGVPGDTCADVLVRWPAVVAQNPTHMFIMCGVNDARTGRTAAAAWADLEDILDDALARGMAVRPILTLNFEGAADADPTKVAMINTLRASISAWCTANSVECADPATDLQTGDEIKDEYDQDDKLHLNAAGQAIFRQHIAKGSWPWP